MTGSFVVGDVTPGSYTISATGSPAEDSVSATFTVSSSALSITLNPTSASVGSTIQLTGVGFSTSDSACSVSDGSSIASETCSVADGSISASFIVANVATGSYTITVTGSPMDDSASATLTVTSSAGSITLNPSSAQVGATVQVSGSGFPSTDSSCSLSGGAVSSPSCSISSGALSGSFIVANVTTGSYAIAALSGPSDDSVSATFTVSSPSSAETTSTNTTRSSSLTTATPDFLLTSTSLVTLTQGGSGSAIVTVTSVNGFNGTVTLVASWLGYTPQGVNLSITSPITPLPNGTVAVPLTITASSTASTGTFALQVTGTSSMLTHNLVSAILLQVLQSASTTSNTSTMTSSASSTSTSTSITTSIPALPTVCPVSTATSGSALAPLAQALRTFRDQSIMKTRTGIAFMTLFNTWYYSFSPRLASHIGSHQNQRTIFRYSLYPLIGALYASYYSYILVSPFSAEIAAVTSGLVAAALIGVAYLALPLYLAKRILKRKSSSSWLKATHLLACSTISGLAVGISYYAGIEVALGIATASLILSTLMLGAILGSMVLTHIEFTYLVRELATLNRVFKTSTWDYAIRQLSSKIQRLIVILLI
ncbi:MAG: CFI-box-CTERM domain-containing protein [Candidatus Bathyarchaeia archaeon]